jgi:hypothetical protein
MGVPRESDCREPSGSPLAPCLTRCFPGCVDLLSTEGHHSQGDGVEGVQVCSRSLQLLQIRRVDELRLSCGAISGSPEEPDGLLDSMSSQGVGESPAKHGDVQFHAHTIGNVEKVQVVVGGSRYPICIEDEVLDDGASFPVLANLLDGIMDPPEEQQDQDRLSKPGTADLQAVVTSKTLAPGLRLSTMSYLTIR